MANYKILFFILLFAYRIKCQEPEDRIEPNIDAKPGCAKDQFQCTKSKECIPKYMYCDYIVDCIDSTDEIKCGTCDFRNNTWCDWTSDDGTDKNAWQLVNGQYIETQSVSTHTTLKLKSPVLKGIAEHCKFILIAKIVGNAEIVVVEMIPNCPEQEVATLKKSKNNVWTEYAITLSMIPRMYAKRDYYHMQIEATLNGPTDRFMIREIRFEDCNPKRTLGDCNFELNDTCHWTRNVSSPLQWTISEADQLNYTYSPTTDHTESLRTGHYLWTKLLNTNGSNETPTARITSPEFNYDICLSFSYYMDGASFSQISIIKEDQFLKQRQTQTVLDKPSNGNWLTKLVNIQRTLLNFVVSIEAQVEDPQGFVAIDDIFVQFGECKNPICTFEEGLCDFAISDSGGNSTWKRVQSHSLENLTDMTFPDHTTNSAYGHMMIFIPETENDISWISSPESNFGGYRCLQFYYYISDDNVGMLEVSHHSGFMNTNGKIPDDTKINGYLMRKQSTLLFAQSWRKVTITLPPIDQSVFDFTATAGSDVVYRFIALDDIQVTNGACREPVSCDFETDSCDWRIDQDLTMGTFERKTAAQIRMNKNRNFCYGPANDHTLKTENGHYFYFCGHGSQQMVGTVKSADFDATQNWCFSMWTQFTNFTNIRVDVYLHNKDSNTQLTSIIGTNETEWKRHEINIIGNDKYEIYFLSISATPFDYIANQGVAFDDFKLSKYKCGYHPNHKDPNKPDDDDGHDKEQEAELIDFGCNFELGTCNYQVDQLNIDLFVETHANSRRRAFGPVADHTYHSDDGGYIELKNNIIKKPNNKRYASMGSKQSISPYMFTNLTINQVCVDFWYVMNGVTFNWLNVTVKSTDNSSMQNVYHREGTFGPTWRHQVVTINFFDDFQLYFEAGTLDLTKGVVAIDDIKVFIGSCRWDLNSVCDFSVDSCGWDNNISLPLKFQIASALVLSFEDAYLANNTNNEVYDHSEKTIYGNYMWLNVTTVDSTYGSAQLISPIIRPNRKCLQFWYYLYGDGVGQMNVYIQYDRLSNLRYILKNDFDTEMNGWMFAQIPIEKHFYDLDFQFIIEIKRGDQYGPDYHVAIDDIKIDEFCQPIGSCDFEDDYCEYENMCELANHGINCSSWSRAHSNSEFFAIQHLQPMGDHTNGRNGIYAYLDIGPVGSLFTPFFSLDAPSCLTFFYYLNAKIHDQLPVLVVELVDLNTKNNTLHNVELALLNNETVKHDPLERFNWMKHSVDINITGKNMMLQFTGIFTNNEYSHQFIALDDIVLKHESCNKTHENKDKFACVANPKSKNDYVNQSQVCNFVSDCNNNEDEKHCGYQCAWDASKSDSKCSDWSVRNVTSTFLVVNLSDTSRSPFKSVNPIRDYKSADIYRGTYLRLYDQPGRFIDEPEANFESPWIQNSGPLCTITFYYYIHDPHDKNALLRVRLIEPSNPLGILVFREQGTEEGKYWKQATISIGRMREQFKVQINARMKVVNGGGTIAIDDIQFIYTQCQLRINLQPYMFTCDSKHNIYHCANKKYCFPESMLCDYEDDCGDNSDESNSYCYTANRLPLRCNFEDGTCWWHLPSTIDDNLLNGFTWGRVEDIDDYAYGITRDHTMNNEFGHLIFLWNQNQRVGHLISPLMQQKDLNDYCAIYFYYVYKSRLSMNNEISEPDKMFGVINVYLKFSPTGKLYRIATVSYWRFDSFQRHMVNLDYETKLTKPFYVVLEVVPGKDSYGIWGIDDISFSSACLPVTDPKKVVTDPTYTPYPITTPTPNYCNRTDQFYCDKGECIYRSQVCDFFPDCRDGTDESNCGENTFKNGWIDQSEGRVWWKVTSDGIAETNVRDGTGSIAYLQSAIFADSSATCSVMFNYYVDKTGEMLQLSMIDLDRKPHRQEDIIFDSRKSYSMKYGQWNTARIFIGEHLNRWQLTFMGAKDLVNNRTNSIRIDKINLIDCRTFDYNRSHCDTINSTNLYTCDNGVCILKNQICDYQDDCGDLSDEKQCNQFTSFRCNFEYSQYLPSNNHDPLCGMKLSDPMKWKRFSGADTRNFIGPGIDHTTDTEFGHFIMLTDSVYNSATINSETQITTPVFDPDNSGNCHLRFWYMLNGIGTLDILRANVGQDDLQLIESIDTSPNDTFIWKRFSQPLITKLSYQIVFSAKIENMNSKTFVAIDDLSFSSNCPLHSNVINNISTTTVNPNSACNYGDQFECIDHTCISYDEVCDFYPTCSQGEDESDCPSDCNFDKTFNDELCYWSEDPDDGNPLLVGYSRETPDSAASITSYYPPIDNSLKQKNGGFMLIYPKNFTKKVDPKNDMNIYSPEFVSASPNCMFHMDFYVAVSNSTGSTSVYTISLLEVTIDGPVAYSLRTINTQDSTLWNRWETLSVGIGRRTNSFQLMLTRKQNPDMLDSLAIDNIRFLHCDYTPPHDTKKPITKCQPNEFTCKIHGNCIAKSEVCDLKSDCSDGSDEIGCKEFQLTFEAKDGFNSSGFTLGRPGRNGKPTWQVISGPAPERKTIQTGPPFDHTFFNKSGHYLYSQPFDYGVDAWFISPMFKSTAKNRMCTIGFYYYMYGMHENEISIYVRNVTQENIVTAHSIKTKSDDCWRSASVPIQSSGSRFQIIISAVSGGNFAGVAIDDIHLSVDCLIDPSKTTLPPGSVTKSTTPTTNTKSTNSFPTTTDSSGNKCKPGKYYCQADDLCLPTLTKCNFVHDCSDGSDEQAPECTQAQCPIKSGELLTDCGIDIFYVEDSKYQWKYSTSKDFTQETKIKFDNMMDEFIYVYLDEGSTNDFSDLLSQKIHETASGCTLKFKYGCDLNKNCPLQATIITHQKGIEMSKLLWVPLNSEYLVPNSGYQTYQAIIYIGRRNNFQVSIGSLRHQAKQNSYVMLGNISFEDCAPEPYIEDPSSIKCEPDKEFKCSKSYGNCIPSNLACNGQDDCRLNEDETYCSNYLGICDFEDMLKCDFWQYNQIDYRFEFVLESGLHGLSYLPSIDHTHHSEANYYLSFHSNLMLNYLKKNGKMYATELYSNIIAGRSTSGCRLRLWHNVIGPKTDCQLYIQKRYIKSDETIQLKRINANHYDLWEFLDLGLINNSTQTGNFVVIIQALVKLTETSCSVNIDDTSLTPECISLGTFPLNPDKPDPNNTIGNLCKPNFMCHNKRCYTSAQRCNFVNDCGDGTDEIDCPPRCSFEDRVNPMCGWYNPIGSVAKFILLTGPSPMRKVGGTGPKVDYSKETINGHYLLAKNFSTFHSKIQFHSQYYISGPSCRFSFAYYLDEPIQKDTISVYLKTDSLHSKKPNITKIWSYDWKKHFANMWNQETIYIGRHDGFSLIIEAIQGEENNDADLAFDELEFLNCHQNETEMEVVCSDNEFRCDDRSQCIEYWRLCDGELDCIDLSDEIQHCTQTNGTCWFTDANWKTRCEWIDLPGMDFKFTFENVPMNSTNEHEINTGPQSLINEQYGYLLMKSNDNRKYGERAAVASPKFPPSKDVCSLGFHYYMYGSDLMGELTVYTLGFNGKRTDYFRITGNQGPQWNYVSNIMVGNAESPYRVVFEGIVGGDQLTDIAIGYVSFSQDCAAGKWLHKGNANLTNGCKDGFYCHHSGECISIDWACDGEEDCPDGTDEMNCEIINKNTKSHRKGLIIAFIVFGVLLIIGGAPFVYRRFHISRADDRQPLFDNSTMGISSTTSATNLSDRYTRIHRTKKDVSFEMTTRRTNMKND